MTYPSLESEIVTQLAPVNALGVQVRTLPESPAEWGQVTGAGWVAFNWVSSVVRDDKQDLQGVGQIERISYALDIRNQSLRSSEGLYAVSNLTKNLLRGFKPTLAVEPISVQQMAFQGHSEGYWAITGEFQLEVLLPASQQELNLPDYDFTTYTQLDKDGGEWTTTDIDITAIP